MLIDTINNNAEYALLSLIEHSNQRNMMWGILRFRFSEIALQVKEEEILLAVASLLKERQAALYFCQDGDIFIAWNGVQKHLVENLCITLYKHITMSAGRNVHSYYDILADGEELRLLCKHKIAALSKNTQKDTMEAHKIISPDPLSLAQFSKEQLALFQVLASGRKRRSQLEILIVEDQLFSSKLLVGMLEHHYKTYVAATAMQAWELYSTIAPDICFLDIELPDVSGHRLAKILKKVDPEACLIMVTANNYLEDVTQAKNTGAKGFIVKPYSKQKILDAIHKFQHDRK
jgi:two-component system chemotaxis response regulator CheY